MDIHSKKWIVLLAALILALLLCGAAQAEGTTNFWIYSGAGTGETRLVGTYAQGETVKAPDCPAEFAPPIHTSISAAGGGISATRAFISSPATT